METVAIDAQIRTGVGKEAMIKLRNDGKLPGNIYGKGKDNLSVSLNYLEMHKLLVNGPGKNTIFSMNIEKKTYDVIPYEIQLHPISKQILHIDFKLVTENEKVRVTVPVHQSGIAIGVKKGGKLDQKMDVIILMVLPGEVPKEILVDVSQLDIGQLLYVRDLKLPPSAEVLKVKPDQRVFLVKGITKSEE